MISGVTMRINIDEYLMNALKEDITQEDVSTNAVMPEPKQGDHVVVGMFRSDVFDGAGRRHPVEWLVRTKFGENQQTVIGFDKQHTLCGGDVDFNCYDLFFTE